MYLQSNLFKSFGISAVTASLESIYTDSNPSSISFCALFLLFFLFWAALILARPFGKVATSLALTRVQNLQVVHEVLLKFLV